MDKEKRKEIAAMLLKNKDLFLLGGQLALVAIVCIAGIRNDLKPADCCKKKKRKK